MRIPTLPLLLCGLLFLPPLADTARAGEYLWNLPDDKEDEYEKLLREGDEFAEAAADAEGKAYGIGRRLGRTRAQPAKQRALGLARRALESYELAVKAAPTNPEPHFRATEVLLAFEIGDNFPPPRPLDRAIEHWRQFERKAPLDPRLPSVLDDRSIALTKRGGVKNLRAAAKDYDHALELIDQSSDAQRERIARYLSNQAELYMMLGDLKKAIAGYERAIEFNGDTTYGYGLAVALDRDHQGVRARDTARIYAKLDSQNALTRGTTFFVPAGEKHYYLAMRHEGRGEYREAMAAYQEFLRLWPGSPWAKRARANRKALAPKAAKQPLPETKKPLRPWPARRP